MSIRVPPSGPLDARIMIVGEAPGEQEERRGEPFIGPTGELLRNFMQMAGIDPAEVFFTNISKIRPPGNKLHLFFLDGGVPKLPVLEGLAELAEEINSVKPNVILAAGNFPLWALTGKARWIDEYRKGKRIRGFTGIQDYRGSILHSSLFGAKGFKVIPTFHPSYIYQQGWKDHPSFLADLTRLKDQSDFPEIRRAPKKVILAAEQPQVLLNYWDVIDFEADPEWMLHDETRFDLRDRLLADPDTPTTADIEIVGSRLLCCGLTKSRDEAIVIPTGTLGDIQYLAELCRATPKFNAQNSMFDASMLEWHYGIEIMSRVTFDTMICQYCANIELPKGLDYLASIYTDHPYYKDMVDWKAIKKAQQMPSTLFVYNGADVVTQHEIMEEQLKWELTDESVNQSFRFLMRLLLPLWQMSKRGIKVDAALMIYVRTVLKSEAAADAFNLMLLAGKTQPLNVKSGPQMAELLYEQLGLPVIRETDSGAAATDDKTIAALLIKAQDEKQKKILRLIRKIRKARDLQSKFFNVGFDEDGRIRGHYDPTKTVTGRLASRKFYPTNKGANQQNIPKDPRARRAFIADPEKIFIYADLERAESLVVAHLTGDPRMLLDHSPGQNAHRNLGALLFNKPPEEIDKESDEYYLAKRTRHAGNYMQGPRRFQQEVNKDAEKTGVAIDFKKATRFIDTYRSVHPGLPLWWEKTKEQLLRDHTLSNLLGFKRRFYDRVNSCLPEAIAFVPQSTVGQLLNLGLLNVEGIPAPYIEEVLGTWSDYADIAEELRDCGFELLQQIHDAIGCQVWAQDLDRAVPLLRKAMSVPLRNPRTSEMFTIPVEVLVALEPPKDWPPEEWTEAGPWRSNWGDVKPYVEDL